MSGMPVGAEIAAAIDAIVTHPVLVVGSPPPTGRDLDLLAAGDDHTAITAWLSAAGFLLWRKSWARFDGTSVYGVDLSSLDRWGSATSDHLLQDAEPIPGYRNLARPSPATVLLLAARGMVTRRGRITGKVRARVSGALERDPQAWTAAEQHARALGMVGALRLLRRAHQASRPLSAPARAAGLTAVWVHGGSLRAKGRIFLDARPRDWRPAVVSFSGLDGSGKSTQVTGLLDALEHLGVAAQVQWAGFKTASKLRRALPVLDHAGESIRDDPKAAETPRPRDPLVPAACIDHRLGRHLWMSSVVAANAVSLWRYVLVPRRGTKVLIFDRFSPDSAVKLDFHYGLNRDFDIRWQRAVFRFLSPKPDVGFLVAVPSDVAYARRQDQTPEELLAMSRLYDEQVPRFGLIRLDGTDPAEVLGQQVVIAAWRGMR